MTKPSLKLASPTPIYGTVPPRRRPNAELRPREYLTEAEVERLMKAAGKNRNGHRDAQHGPAGLPARASSRRTGDAALGQRGLGTRQVACEPGQERLALRAPR